MVENILRLVVAPLLGMVSSYIGLHSYIEQSEGWLYISLASLLFVIALLFDTLKHQVNPYCSNKN